MELKLKEVLKLNPQPWRDVLRRCNGELLARYGEPVLTNPLGAEIINNQTDEGCQIDTLGAHFEKVMTRVSSCLSA